MKLSHNPRTKRRDSSYGEISEATTITSWRSRRLARNPTRRTWASRSARVNPVCGKMSRIVSPSRCSTRIPRRSSSSSTFAAIVLLPEPDRPVNQTTAAWPPRLPTLTRSHARSCSQKSPIFETNSSPPTASDIASLRVKANTSSDVAMVPSILHVKAFAIDLVCDSLYMGRRD